MEQQKHLTRKQTQAVALGKANGSLSVLAIGIDDYAKSSGFIPLKTCSNDAVEVRNAFQDVWQLGADKDKIRLLTSRTTPTPSRGEIIIAIKSLVSMAGPDDRILFYYSGHGHKVDGRFYIVPQDAYSYTDPSALIDFAYILEELNASGVKQRILAVDACMSGPEDVTMKRFLAAAYSKDFLAEYMRNTKGVAFISSSTANQPSTSQSPNPKLSLFTHYFVKALRGEPSALDSFILTIDSLYNYISTEVQRCAKTYQKKQLPCIDVKASGTIILGNFGQAIVSPDSFEIEELPVSELVFKDWYDLDVQEVLTDIRRWTYTESYLEEKVNENLGGYLEKKLGVKVSELRKNMGFSATEVGVDGNGIRFPGGTYTAEYVANDKKHGKIVYSLIFERDWFGRKSDIATIIKSFKMVPDRMIFELTKSIEPQSVIAGLEAQEWEMKSELPTEVIAEKSSYTLTVTGSKIIIEGFTMKELFGNEIDKEKIAIASNALALIASKV